MNKEILRAHVYLSGQVQGVGMRAHVRTLARRFDVVGLVRNLEDGRVEVLAEGEKEVLIKFFQAIKQGPLVREIEHLDLSWEKPSSKFSDFDIAY